MAKDNVATMVDSSSSSLAAGLRDLSMGIAAYLSEYISSRKDFGMRSFYGETFTLALLQKSGMLNSRTEEKLIDLYKEKDRRDSQFHWEFNNYALMESGRLHPPVVFKDTQCTNWTLLRSTVRIRASVDVAKGMTEAVTKVRRMQKRSGLILDDPGVRSFQYHCFSAAMLYELYCNTKDPFFLDAFTRAVSFIRRFILPDGDTLYIGRGQQQSFGYASLVYVLAACYGLSHDRTVLGDLARVTYRIALYRKPDGSLPLVLGGGKEPLPHPDAPHREPDCPGWYAYNNYFDYLPFSGLFIRKAADALLSAPVAEPLFEAQEPYRDSDFLKLVSGETIGIVSRPGGYWTNDMPVPYVYSGGRARTPCYGGEQFEKSIYSVRGIPLPITSGGISIRSRARSFFVGNTLVVVSPVGVLVRCYKLFESRVEMRSRVFSPLRFRDRYLFLEEAPAVRSSFPVIARGTEYSAQGKLTTLDFSRVGDVLVEFGQ